MHDALIYHPGDRLSLPELMAARLDGHVIEVGSAFMPFDTIENARARALSLRPEIRGAEASLAFVGETAAWIHGAVHEPPDCVFVQRTGASFTRPKRSKRIRYFQAILGRSQREQLADIWVSTPQRTLIDLCRRPDLEGEYAAAAMIVRFPQLAEGLKDSLGELTRANVERAEEQAAAMQRELSAPVSSTSPDRRRRPHRYDEPR